MNIFSVNANMFGKTLNKFKNKYDWNSSFNYNLRKVTANDIAKYVTDDRNGIDIAIFQEIDYQDNFEDFVSYFIRKGYQVKIPQGIGLNPCISFTNMIVAKEAVQITYMPNSFSEAIARWQEVKIAFKDKKLYLLNIHSKDEERFKISLSNYIQSRKDFYSIIMGDLNAASSKDRDKILKKEENVILSNSEFLQVFEDNSYLDIKGENPFTFYPSGEIEHGRRLDHSFVSKSIRSDYKLIGDTIENTNIFLNEAGFTDHSAIVLEIDENEG